MTEEPKSQDVNPGKVIHFSASRTPLSESEQMLREMELRIAGHFQKQNLLLSESNNQLMDKVQRLTNGVESLVNEMAGVRTGKKEEAFARVAGSDALPDLPTVSAEAALIYTLTASMIGAELGFHASQIGLLLGSKGLSWAGDGTYQEIGRTTKASQSKFWHMDVSERLRRILNENDPAKFNITNKTVLSIFRKWHQRQLAAKFFEELPLHDTPH